MSTVLPSWKDPIAMLQPFAKVNYIVADLDGTLVGQQKNEVVASIGELRRALRHYSTRMTLATGRTLFGVRDIVCALDLPSEIPIIIYNGSVVVTNKSFNPIYQLTIPIESLNKIVDIGLEYECPVLAYFYHPIAGGECEPGLNEEVVGWSITKKPKREVNGMTVSWIEGHYSKSSDMLSAILLGKIGDEKRRSAILDAISKISDISVTTSGGDYVEIRPADSDKGKALRAVAQHMGWDREQILAIGDNDNDAEMLRWAGLSVAVHDSSAVAARASDFICRYGAVKGTIEALRLVKHAKRYGDALNSSSSAVKVGS